MNADVEKPVPPSETDESVSRLVGSEGRRLAVHSAQYMTGLLGSMLFGLISFPIFTRLFSVADYGILDLAQKLVLLLTVLSKAGLQNAVVRFYDRESFAQDSAAENTFFSTMTYAAFANALAAGSVFVAGCLIVQRFYGLGVVGAIIHVIAILAMLRAVGSILWAFLRVEERTVAFNVLTIGLRAATIASVLVVVFASGPTASSYLVGVIAAEAIFVAGLLIWLRTRDFLAAAIFDTKLYRMGLTFGVPLVLYEFGFTTLGSADRMLVQRFLGPEALGVYSVAAGLSQQANDLLVGPLMLALSPIYMKIWLAKGAGETSRFLSVALDVFVAIAFGLLAMATVTAREVVLILASGKYLGADQLIPWLLGGLLVFATHLFFVAGLMIHRLTLQVAGILALSATCNIGLNWLLLPRLGLRGGAIAAVVSSLACVLLLAWKSWAVLPLDIAWLAAVRYGGAAIIACFTGWGVGHPVPIVCFSAKAIVTALTYIGVLYAIDARVRIAVAKGVRLVRALAA